MNGDIYIYIYIYSVWVRRRVLAPKRVNIIAIFYIYTCTVRLLLLRTVTKKCTIISQIVTLPHVSTL